MAEIADSSAKPALVRAVGLMNEACTNQTQTNPGPLMAQAFVALANEVSKLRAELDNQGSVAIIDETELEEDQPGKEPGVTRNG